MHFHQPELDWSLRAADPPYHDLGDLAAEFGLGSIPSKGSTLDVAALQVAAVEYNSPFKGTTVTPRFRINTLLDRTKVSIGIRVVGAHQPIERFTVPNSEISWEPFEGDPNVVVGTFSRSVPEAALVQCIVSYNGVAIHFGWLSDPNNSQNTSRLVLETFDPSLKNTLQNADPQIGKGKSGQSKDQESTITSILWLLGFSVLPIWKDPQSTDAVDVIARTPRGNFLLVECTTGLLKAQNKLANLAKRAAQVRRTLSQSSDKQARVLPVIVTSLRAEEVGGEMEQAEREGIKVFTIEDMTRYLSVESKRYPDPEALFAEAEKYLREKHPDTEIGGGSEAVAAEILDAK